MRRITDYYGIRGPVPFADVGVDLDNKLYLDPYKIRLDSSGESYALHARWCLDSYFDTVARCVMSTDSVERAYGEAVLKMFSEPWETRLGMSANGFRGRGGGNDVGSWIWDALNGKLDALLRVGVLKYLEELPMFVEGIDRDITSDITTRIVFSALAEFTEAMLALFPEFSTGPHRTMTITRQIWDPNLSQWTDQDMEVPAVDGRPLLLVPSAWVGNVLLMSAGRYYETTILTYAQGEQSRFSRAADEVKRLPKRLVRKLPGLGRGRSTNLRVTMRAIDNSENLVEVFRRFAAERRKERGDEGVG
ncbi:hypothetical protein [Gordonia sp. HS-NH1]|uniref:hypothetical protein n=1 Tax=Gordonia sp. HS-NH1 TaxID=1435068 RepID=UPI0006E2FFF3|nr:hypothetical protein [Gordonia sp. HS-NH1]